MSASQKPVESQLLVGDALTKLAEVPANFIDVIVTSPPYFRQRDYSASSQVGQEVSPELYVRRIVDVFREARRVVKDHGSLWLVLGDKYTEGELLGMPWRVALALQADGWFLRSDVIWHKPNAMPSSTKTRPTTDHEYVFFFTKSR